MIWLGDLRGRAAWALGRGLLPLRGLARPGDARKPARDLAEGQPLHAAAVVIAPEAMAYAGGRAALATFLIVRARQTSLEASLGRRNAGDGRAPHGPSA